MGAIERRNPEAVRSWAPSSRISRLLEPTPRAGVGADGQFEPRELWECPAIIGADLLPALRSDAQSLEAFLASGCAQGVAEKCLVHLSALTKTRADIPPAEAKLRVRAIANMLAEYPQVLVEQACRRYAQESVFFPALAELVALIKPELLRYENKLAALRVMVAKVQADAGQTDEARAAESDEVRAAAVELSAAMRRKLAGHATPEDVELVAAAARKHRRNTA